MIAVIGAGISGLSCAWWLHRAGQQVELFEATSHVGGKVDTVSEEGVQFETGPNTLLLNDEQSEWLSSMGLTLVPATRLSRQRFVLQGGRYRSLPSDPLSFLFSSLLSASAKRALLVEPWLRNTPLEPHETVAAFFRRRLGQEWLDVLVAPFVAGVFAGDPETLLMEECLPLMLKVEQRSGSLVKGMMRHVLAGKLARKTPYSLAGGLISLPTALASGLSLQRNCPVERLQREGSGWRLQCASASYYADEVVLSVPADEAARLLGEHVPELSSALTKIPYAPMSLVVSLGARADMTRPLRGFGGLNPVSETPFAAGHLMGGDMFPDRCDDDDYLIVSYVGGSLFRQHHELPDRELLEGTNEELRDVFGLTRPVRRQWLVRHPRALPQGTAAMVDVRKHLAALDGTGLHVCANWLDGVSVSDCLAKGEALACRLLRRPLLA